MRGEQQSPRYYLVACGTHDYDADPDSLLDIRGDIVRVTRTFAQFGYQRILEEISLNPSRDFPSALADWLNSSDRSDSDYLIIYYSGHGMSIPADQHYLILKTSDPEKLLRLHWLRWSY